MSWTKGDTYPDQSLIGDESLFEVTTYYTADPTADGTPEVEWTYFVTGEPGSYGVREQVHSYTRTGDPEDPDYADESYEYEWADVRIFDTFEGAKARAEHLAAEDQSDLLDWTEAWSR